MTAAWQAGADGGTPIPPSAPPGSLLEVTDLAVTIPTEGGRVEAVRGVSLSLAAGQTLGVVGESGSGKTMLALSVLGLLPGAAQVTGSVRLSGTELLGGSEAQWQRIRGEKIAMVFQDPMTALNPMYSVGWQVAECVLLHRKVSRQDAWRRAVSLLDAAGLPEAGPDRQAVSARAVRRHAPAGGHRDGHRQRARPAHRRRADDCAGRHRAGADPRHAGRGPPADRRGDDPDQPRPGRGRRGGGPGHGHVRGPGGRVRAGRRGVRRAADAVHGRPAGLAAVADRAARPAGRDRRRPAGRHQLRRGLRLCAPLPGRLRYLRYAARAGGSRARASRRLPFRGRERDRPRRRPRPGGRDADVGRAPPG